LNNFGKLDIPNLTIKDKYLSIACCMIQKTVI
jgi:hypothetical protein